jgi:hypothetical protein
MEQEAEYFDLPESTPSGVCGWCHIKIPKEYEYHGIHGNMCDVCSKRVTRSINGIRTREEVNKNLIEWFDYIHNARVCVKPGCNKNKNL